jgi:hypothetical protein
MKKQYRRKEVLPKSEEVYLTEIEENRARLADLIGKLLARYWLKQQARIQETKLDDSQQKLE